MTSDVNMGQDGFHCRSCGTTPPGTPLLARHTVCEVSGRFLKCESSQDLTFPYHMLY
jgi:hypothetical protein